MIYFYLESMEVFVLTEKLTCTLRCHSSIDTPGYIPFHELSFYECSLFTNVIYIQLNQIYSL